MSLSSHTKRSCRCEASAAKWVVHTGPFVSKIVHTLAVNGRAGLALCVCLTRGALAVQFLRVGNTRSSFGTRTTNWIAFQIDLQMLNLIDTNGFHPHCEPERAVGPRQCDSAWRGPSLFSAAWACAPPDWSPIAGNPWGSCCIARQCQRFFCRGLAGAGAAA